MSAPEPQIVARCRVTNVVDGDTVDLELTTRLRVRLLDCWAPEKRTKDLDEKRRGMESYQHLQAMAEGKHGVVQIPTEHALSVLDVLSLERLLGRVYLDDGTNLSEAQVVAGYAASHKESD